MSTELVGNTAQQRNWRGIAIALLVIIVVCALIITAVILATPKVEEQFKGEKFTLDDFLDKSFKPKTLETTWLSGDRFLYRNHDGALHEFNCSTNSSSLLLDNTTFRQLDTDVYWLSADEEYVLFKHDINQVFRHSSLASYTAVKLSTKGEYPIKGPNEGRQLQYVGWSSKGNALVLVQDFNIYYLPSVRAKPVTITSDGRRGEIYNGIPDWLYEEEVVASDHALWWSPNGNLLCYAVYNDTLVHPYIFPVYGDAEDAYTRQERIPYPKPGFPNPTVQLKVVNVSQSSPQDVTLQPPVAFRGKEFYVTVVSWMGDRKVFVTWVNRAQNDSYVTLCSPVTGVCDLSIHQTGFGGWVNLFSAPVFSPDFQSYFWALPQRHQSESNFQNVAKVQIKDVVNGHDIITYLTLTRWDVTSIEAYDHEADILYFIGTGGDPRRRHLFSVDVQSKQRVCLTCEVDEERCQYVSASFSPSAQYYILNCQGPGIPFYSLRSPQQEAELKRLENNTVFADRIAVKGMPKIKYIQVELNNDNKDKAWGKLLLPPVLNEDEVLLYPLLVSVYGGPGTQHVTEQYAIKWETYLVSSRDIVVLYIDGRGTGGRGNKWLHTIYKKLGSVEVDDTITATQKVAKYHYIDNDKVSIWGWSYGGYLTASVLGRGTKTKSNKALFRCGISVAPVTDWIYYDSAYTERYMGFPTAEDNLQGYKVSNVSLYVDGLKESRLLLVHGTGDDNVHFQQSAQLMKAMVEADVYFRTLVYPDKHHGLLGGNTRRHLYNNLDDFLGECFDGVSDRFGFLPDTSEDA